MLVRLAIVLLVVAGVAVPASAAPEEDLAAAQRRANRAAAELSEAHEEMALAQDALASTKTRVAQVEGRVSGARDHVRRLALYLYVDGTAGLTRLLRFADASDLVRAQQYSRVAAGMSTDALGRYRAEREDLADELVALERKEEEQADALAALRARQADASAEVDRLARVVARAQAARDAERRGLERVAQAASGNTGAASSAAASSPATPSAGERSAPAPAAGAPAAPSAAVAPAAPAGDFVCPVQGPHAFSNDYGASRGGGSSHQGNDILAPRGTPVVASVNGVVSQRNGATSGLAYFLHGDNGVTYFGAHLDSFGASGPVSAGTVIGTVGNTGDASGGPPHLHFEMHPGGWGNPVNPYSTLTRYC